LSQWIFIISSCGWMQICRCLHWWPMTSWIRFSSTAAHASIGCCTFVLCTRCWILFPRLCSQLDWGQNCLAATNLKVYRCDHDLWDYCTFKMEAANDAQTVWVNTACGKAHSQKILSKPILWYRNIFNQITSDVWETDNCVQKLTTDKLQPVLINMLIKAIFEH